MVNRKSKRKTNKKKRTKKQSKITVHQIFGLMGDTTLPPLFKKSQEAFKSFCKKNNYKYKFWNKNACEKLTKLPEGKHILSIYGDNSSYPHTSLSHIITWI